MTLQPTANRDEVLFRASGFGYSQTLAHAIPTPPFNTSSNSGGSVSPGSYGALVQSGASNGDYAEIESIGMKGNPADFTQFGGRVLLEYLFIYGRSFPAAEPALVGPNSEIGRASCRERVLRLV